MIGRPPRSTLFPSTPLSRSVAPPADRRCTLCRSPSNGPVPADQAQKRRSPPRGCAEPRRTSSRRRRSEEHTSELQSRSDLVCRLLLGKQKLKQPLQSHLLYI